MNVTEELLANVRLLLDRQAISDCVIRYCRAVDRFDRDLLRTVYHEDATDDHGAFCGGREAFIDWAFAYHNEYQISHHHIITNHMAEIEGDTAHAETYWLFFGENRTKPDTVAVGRYVDRFEKRDGHWAIAARVCVTESINELTPAEIPEVFRQLQMGNATSARSKDDVSWMRPLNVRQPV
ncbi:nuclear transport factor 2 family protein [Pseudomonas fluorescens]